MYENNERRHALSKCQTFQVLHQLQNQTTSLKVKVPVLVKKKKNHEEKDDNLGPLVYQQQHPS